METKGVQTVAGTLRWSYRHNLNRVIDQSGMQLWAYVSVRGDNTKLERSQQRST